MCGRMGNRRVGLFEKVGEWELGGWENGRGFRRGCEAEIGLCLCVRGKAIDASQENGEKVQVCPGRREGGGGEERGEANAREAGTLLRPEWRCRVGYAHLTDRRNMVSICYRSIFPLATSTHNEVARALGTQRIAPWMNGQNIKQLCQLIGGQTSNL